MDLVKLFLEYGAWSWLVLGLALLALELLVPGGYFLWLGVAGLITGVASFIQPFDWPVQVLIFGFLSLVAVFAWSRYTRALGNGTDRPFLNQRAFRFVGQEAILSDPIQDGFGRIALDDTTWRVSGPDMAAGTKIRIVGADGPVLRVEAA